MFIDRHLEEIYDHTSSKNAKAAKLFQTISLDNSHLWDVKWNEMEEGGVGLIRQGHLVPDFACMVVHTLPWGF